jgi:hypothetical protein
MIKQLLSLKYSLLFNKAVIDLISVYSWHVGLGQSIIDQVCIVMSRPH